jgi:hypothetical protein
MELRHAAVGAGNLMVVAARASVSPAVCEQSAASRSRRVARDDRAALAAG